MKHSNLNNDDFTSNIDGDVLQFVAVNANNNVPDYMDEMCMNADGSSVADDFYDAEGYSNLFEQMKKNRAARQKRRDIRTQSKADARQNRSEATKTRAEAKVGMSEAQKLAAKAGEAGVAGDVAMAGALASSAPKESKSKGMSTGAKVGIAIGVIVVLGVVGFVIYKKMKNKKA